MQPGMPSQNEPPPQNELERVMADAQAGPAPTEDALRALVRLPLFVPSRRPVEADGAGLAPVVLTQGGGDFVAVYTAPERAGALADQAGYGLQVVGGDLLARLPASCGLAVNVGSALGLQIDAAGVQKILSELIAPSPLLSQIATPGLVCALRFQPDGASLIGGQSDGEVALWQSRDVLRATSTFPTGMSRLFKIALSPDGTRLATAGRGPLRLWRLPEGTREREYPFADDSFTSATFSPDGTRLLAVGDEEELHVISLRTGGVEFASQTAVDPDNDSEFALGERTPSLVYHPDGMTLLATACWQGGSALKFCELDAGMRPRPDLTVRLPADVLSPAAFSPDGRLFAVADWDIHLYRFPTQERVASFDAQGAPQTGPPLDRGSAVVEAFWSNPLFTPDGKTLLCGSPNGAIFLWDVPSGNLRRTLTGHDGAVLALALDPTGTRLASSGRDKTLRLWKLPGEEAVTERARQRGRT